METVFVIENSPGKLSYFHINATMFLVMQGYTRKKNLALCDRTLENFDRPLNDTNVLCELLFYSCLYSVTFQSL